MRDVKTMGVDLREGKTEQVVSAPWRRVPRIRFWPIALLVVLCAACLGSARLLVVDEPRKADVILVLAGETNKRPERALQLAAQGYAGRVIVNVPDWSRIYDRSELTIAREWAKEQGASVSICPTHGLSTKDEARDTQRCLEEAQAHSVLIVTSDFHTRRALSTLRRELPGYDFGVASAYDPREFGVNWWRHRQWTKTNFYEWSRLLWWELVDRWF